MMRSKRNITATKKYDLEDYQEVRATGNRLGGLDTEQNRSSTEDDQAIKVTKPAVEGGAGISLVDRMDNFGNNEVIISSIKADSPFYDSDLKRGMVIVTINDYNCPDADAGELVLNPKKGTVSIVAKSGGAVLSTPSKMKKKKVYTPLAAMVKRANRTGKKKKKKKAIKQRTARFKTTPSKTSKRNQRNFRDTVTDSVRAIGHTILPDRSEERRKEIMKDPIMKYFDVETGKLVSFFHICLHIDHERINSYTNLIACFQRLTA